MRDMFSGDQRITVVSRDELLEILTTNREKHINEYDEAVKGYLETARKKLNDQYEKAKSEIEKSFQRTNQELERFDPEDSKDTIVFCPSLQFKLTAPRNFVDAYDQAIEMMCWEKREEVELNTTEFRCFVMNKWDWMEEFKTVSKMYVK